jgi:hypothetical protein
MLGKKLHAVRTVVNGPARQTWSRRAGRRRAHEPDDDVLLDVFRRVHEGTLDVAATFAKAGYPITSHVIDLV